MRRRPLLSLAGAVAGHHVVASTLPASTSGTVSDSPHVDIKLLVEQCSVETGKGINLKTVAYNDQVPGPTLRPSEGKQASIEVTNSTSDPDLVHWHGLAIDSLCDGACDIGSVNGSQFDSWTINSRSWPDIEPLHVRQGKRYRLIFRNGCGNQDPMRLHRHTFEITKIGKTEMSGLFRDLVNVMPLDSVAVDFVADSPGNTLIRGHQQLHMDYGFMQLKVY
jgi:FtsP/CotA-like multicopper oxidase with cupredoxin domain